MMVTIGGRIYSIFTFDNLKSDSISDYFLTFDFTFLPIMMVSFKTYEWIENYNYNKAELIHSTVNSTAIFSASLSFMPRVRAPANTLAKVSPVP